MAGDDKSKPNFSNVKSGGSSTAPGATSPTSSTPRSLSKIAKKMYRRPMPSPSVDSIVAELVVQEARVHAEMVLPQHVAVVLRVVPVRASERHW